MAAMAAASLLSAHSQRKAEMKAKVADAKLQRARLEKARTRSTEDYVANSQRAREATQNREVQIEENRLDAEANRTSAFAGSGISGTSISEIDAEIETEATRNKMENRKALDQQLSDISKNYTNTMKDTADQSAAIDTTAVRANPIGDIAQAASTASSFQSFDTKVGRSLGLWGGK